MSSQRVRDLFNARYGQNLELNRLEISGSVDAINFVSRTARNNGISARVKPVAMVALAEAGCLTVACGGSVLETFVQPAPFYCGRDVYILEPKAHMSLVERLWWATCIRANKYRYNYGRQANRTFQDLPLPDKVPGWLYEEAELCVAGISARLASVADNLSAA
jgi:hypothetical protein